MLVELVTETSVELEEDFDNAELSLEVDELEVPNTEELENSSVDVTILPSKTCQRLSATSADIVAP